MDFLVKSAEIVERKLPAGNRVGNFDETRFVCHLTDGADQNCYFDVQINGRDARGAKVYEAIRPYFKKGKIIICHTAYLLRTCELSMIMYAFTPITGISLSSGRAISGEDYINPRRGYWVRSEVTGPYTHLQDIVMLHGHSQIPILDVHAPMRHFPPGQYEEGLRWGYKRSWIGKLLFG